MVGSNPHHHTYKENSMTIKGLIDKVKEEKPNTFSDAKLLSFVNEIETEVAEQLCEEFTPYTAINTTELMCPAPYDRLYDSYLKAMIDRANEEYESYSNNQAQHVQDFRDFNDWIVREGVATNHVAPSRFRNIF